ncbi:MAG TPA: NAD-dependent epimerase/dehydratase family protein [Polyangia bacterium]|nr:NAD-dependent epimerase/dehydratase family protein [Polyangia bacterium]
MSSSKQQPIAPQRFIIVGGAGFIGSHFCDHLLGPAGAAGVTIYDNYSSGRAWHHAAHDADPRFRVVRGEVEDTRELAAAMDGHDVVIHLASNPDIARAAREPTIDFTQGTALTQSVVEAMRVTSAKRILYASGSGVYGELGSVEAQEDHGPLIPVSTYGASKLAGEALIASYAYMFDLRGCGFRFGNVVGPRQTHGVGFDFARRLLASAAAGEKPIVLKILGDGSQSKSYVHVSDIVRAVLTAHEKTAAPFTPYNVATGDYITVREIAALAVECVGLRPDQVSFEYSGGDRGWKGDVPIVRLDTARIQSLGWRCELTSREALRRSMLAMIPDMKAGRM